MDFVRGLGTPRRLGSSLEVSHLLVTVSRKGSRKSIILIYTFSVDRYNQMQVLEFPFCNSLVMFTLFFFFCWN